MEEYFPKSRSNGGKWRSTFLNLGVMEVNGGELSEAVVPIVVSRSKYKKIEEYFPNISRSNGVMAVNGGLLSYHI